jgi:FAD/FMN-containing dehydrogenase
MVIRPRKAKPPAQPRTLGARVRRFVRLVVGLTLALLALTFFASLWGTLTTRVERPPPPPTVNDITRLNPIVVSRVITPTTTTEIVDAVREHPGPISIGGGRYSMGGQTATDGALQIDMRRFNQVLSFSPASKTITVQAGTRWRQIQEHVDSAGLSVKIMQTYANFTVGGSLSVNVHGRYVGLGPVILSVKSIKVVLADGSLVEASPTKNPEIFYGVIGGYGGLGVITEATLELADNVKVKRYDRTLPISQYRKYFFELVRDSPSSVFHNADIYPDDYSTVRAVTYERTDAAVTVPERLIPVDRSYALNRFVYWVISEWPFGKTVRQHLVDPIVYAGEPVTWRNYEASYDVAELEPRSRKASTYVLQEYFAPAERFDEFVPKMRDILRRHRVNVINVSIRHARQDPGSLLAWAPTEVFAFVLYYKQGTDAAARERVGVWTRELVDAALSVGGSYYLPYQPHATEEQFLRAYSRAPEFFALKRRLDPGNKFRNRLWDKYYEPRVDVAAADLSAGIRARLAQIPGYRRDEGQTFLSHPEWYIVYSSDEYAQYLADRLPTDFPYLASIGQYWVNYKEALSLTRREYPFNWEYQTMLAVIGASYSVELSLKSLYENTVGRFTGWTAGHQPAEEDRYAHTVAADYARFIHLRPWYEYRFAPHLAKLWTEVPLWGRHPIRKWERKLILSLEYGIKAGYATLIEKATRATSAPQAERMQWVVTGWDDSLAARDGRIQRVAQLDTVHTLVATPRYDEFRDLLLQLAPSAGSLRIKEIAGNDDIFLTGVAPAGWQYGGNDAVVTHVLPLPTDSLKKRVAVRVPVRHLLPFLAGIEAEDRVAVDHVYDY